MYTIYHTEAIVLGYKNSGEYDRVYTLLTHMHGIVYAKATGIRRLSSKSRYALTLFSLVEVDLVRGKQTWRLTQAKLLDQFPSLPKSHSKMIVAAKVSKLIRRLCVHDEALVGVYDSYKTMLQNLDGASATKEATGKLELFFVIKILIELGYIGDGEIRKSVESDMQNLNLHRSQIVKEINKALKQSQM